MKAVANENLKAGETSTIHCNAWFSGKYKPACEAKVGDTIGDRRGGFGKITKIARGTQSRGEHPESNCFAGSDTIVFTLDGGKEFAVPATADVQAATSITTR